MTSTVDNATVASLKKAIIQFKRKRLNQSKMKKAELQSAVRALQIDCCPGAPVKKTRTKRKRMAVASSSKRSMKERRQAAKLIASKNLSTRGKKPKGTRVKIDDDVTFKFR